MAVWSPTTYEVFQDAFLTPYKGHCIHTRGRLRTNTPQLRRTCTALSLTRPEWTACSPASSLFTLTSNQQRTLAQVHVAVNEDRIGKVWGHHSHRKATHSALLFNLGHLRLKPLITLWDTITTNFKAVGARAAPPVTSETVKALSLCHLKTSEAGSLPFEGRALAHCRSQR